ncbi:PPP4R2-domain-containing protein [Melanogaster broomeanus]|nr:PPP4R2-domain-containing protein [Melanogaster broomeanus]
MTSAAQSPYSLSKDFQWSSGYQSALEQIASTDVIEPNTEWEQLREMIKYKIEQNITLFLAEAAQNTRPEESSKPTTGIPDSCGNLRLPPFPPRRWNELNPHEAPKVHMDQDEATDAKNLIFRQLHEFDDKPPFTIQRVCELCVSPLQHYKFIGKYLRAVEKSLLVTSTWDAFPPEPPQNGFSMATLSFGPSTQSVPTTPLFSPIPFLHDDARRSNSRSPPPSPLTLAAMEGTGNIELLNETMSQRAIGLVDELDNPSPGHMSDHPTALSSVTTVASRPFLETLESRFVRGCEEQTAMESESGMAVDEADDKENKG